MTRGEGEVKVNAQCARHCSPFFSLSFPCIFQQILVMFLSKYIKVINTKLDLPVSHRVPVILSGYRPLHNFKTRGLNLIQ